MQLLQTAQSYTGSKLMFTAQATPCNCYKLLKAILIKVCTILIFKIFLIFMQVSTLLVIYYSRGQTHYNSCSCLKLSQHSHHSDIFNFHVFLDTLKWKNGLKQKKYKNNTISIKGRYCSLFHKFTDATNIQITKKTLQ